MKTINILECRICGQEYFGDSNEIKLLPFEEIAFIIRKISKCSTCIKREDRTIAGSKKRANI